ncbi:MAG: RluA family pseudouridine synthase [Spirochaetes bacterium]|nr:RluA family pseudouridine synthase [Spirochaetota bacterium]
MQFKVSAEVALLDFLTKAYTGKSRTSLKAMLAKRLVSVDGRVTTQFNHTLTPGQTVVVGKRTPLENVSLNGVTIIYDDDHLVVIEKSAGLLSVPTDTGKERTAHGIVAGHLKRVNPRSQLFIVHRLDRETSGLMMFVKQKALQVQLRQNWQESILTRSYAVVVEGRLAQDTGKIVSWLKGTDTLRTYSSAVEGEGQKAITHYQVVAASSKYTLVDVNLETGRKNQIRVHMQDLGHPVVGDEKYGAATDPLKRLGLHARELKFTHPVTGRTMAFTSPRPKEFMWLLKS